MEFGHNFKYYRTVCNMTQRQVAKLLGIAQTNISNWENNHTRPEYENLVKLSSIYGVSIDQLLGKQ